MSCGEFRYTHLFISDDNCFPSDDHNLKKISSDNDFHYFEFSLVEFQNICLN